MASTEQRRYSRLATKLDARVRAAGASLRGQVRDYCLKGMLVVPIDAPDRSAAGALAQGETVEVEFEGLPTLRAIVARADESGLGLQVVSMPDEAVAALRAAAEDVPADALPTGSGRVVAAAARQAMQRECQRRLAAALNDTLKAFFSALPAALDTAADALEGATLRSRFSGAAHQIARDRAGITARFDAALRATMRDPTGREGTAVLQDALSELSLVEQDEFEEWLSLSAVVNRIESDHSLPLTELRRRYGALRMLPLDRVSDPFGPEAIMRAFQQALTPLELPPRVRAVVYDVLGSALRERCESLYAALNQTLVPLIGPPTTRRAPRRALRPPSEPTRAQDQAPSATPARSQMPTQAPPQSPTSPGPAASNAPVRPNGRGTPSAEPASQGPPTGPLTYPPLPRAHDTEPIRPARRSDETTPSARRTPAAGIAAPFGRPPAEASRNLHELIGRLRIAASAEEAAVDESPVTAGRVLTDPAALPGLLDALLAAAQHTGATAGADPSGPGLSQRLSPAIGALPLAPAQRRTVESATGLIGRALTEPDADGAIRRLLRRLEAPLLRLALRDPSFLESNDHPGRRLVDLIEQCSIATDDHGRFEDPKLDRLLNRIVDRVVADAGRDPAVMDRHGRLLERLLGPLRAARRRRVERLQQAFEAREAARAARRRVDAALADRFGTRPIPAAIHALLDAGWTQHLVLAEIRSGGASHDGERAIAALARLVAAISGDPDVTPADGRATVRDEIEPVLHAFGTEPQRIEACLNGLDAALDATARQGVTLDTAPLPGPVTEPDAADDPRLVFARRLRIGEWWQQQTGHGTRALQLVWTSSPPRACGFASRSAGERHELSLEVFASEAQAGRMRPCGDRDRPLLERSELELLDEGWQSLRRRAQCDPVTGLPNRREFLRSLEHADVAGLWVGLVRFDTVRMVGARCGLDAAESLMRSLAARTREALGADVLIASHRDDTLAIAVPADDGTGGEDVVAVMLEQLRDHPYEHGTQRYRVGVNVGLARFVPGVLAAQEAVGRAEAACAAAREQGRNKMQVYEHSSRELRSQESLNDWAGQLDRMLEGSGLYLRCQRIEPLGGDPSLAAYYEVLLGIESVDGSIEPTLFVPVVERLKRSHELDLWVMRNTLDWIDAHPEAFAAIGGFSINVSPRSLDSPEILRLLQERLPQLGEVACKLTFELTETSAIECYGAAQDFIRQVRRYGCRLSLDDFGSGYASYAHLRNLRTDVLKIDGSFVRDIATNPGDLAMVRSMHELARSLGMRSVAEYVETEAVREMLCTLGIDFGQGYAIHAPCRIDTLAAPPVAVTVDDDAA